MAGDFDLSARITADASGLVQAGAQAEAAYEGVGRAGQDAAAGARELEAATEAATKAQDEQTRSERGLTAAHEEAARAARGNTTETLAQVIARERAAKAAIDTAAAEARLSNAQSAAERSAAAAALAALRLEQAQTRHSASTTQLDRDLAQLRAELDPVGEAQRRLAAATDLANTALARGIITQEQYEGHLRRLTQAGAANTADANRQAYAVRNLGQQFGDLGTQVALGGGFARAFASQAGQMGYALSEFGGTLGKVGGFLVGPWGIALTTAAVLAAPFIGKLFEGSNAAQEMAEKLATAATAADSYGTAQSLLGKIIDLTTGRLKTQNAVLIQTIKLQAQANILAAQAEQKKATTALGDVAKPTFKERFLDSLAGVGASEFDTGAGERFAQAQRDRAAALAPVKSAVEDYIRLTQIAGASQSSLDRGLDATIRRIDALGKTGKLAGRDLIDVKSKVLALGTTLNDQKANQLALDAIAGKGIAPELKPYEKPKKPKAPKSTAARDEFGRDAADKIAGIVGQFDEAPPVLDKTNAKIRELDDLIDDLSRKKPPGFEDLIAKAEAAKIVVRDGLIREVAKAFEQPKTLADKAGVAIKQLDAVIADLNANKPAGFEKLIADARVAQDVVRNGLQKPFADFVKDQRDSLEVQRLMAEGRVDEANALKTIQQLQAQMGPLTQEQRDAVLATTQAMRAQAAAIDDLRRRNAKYVEAIGGIKTVVEDATQAFVRGDLGQLLKSPGKLLDVFQQFQGRQLFDRIFGGVFEELQDQVNGTSVVKDASDRMATAVDKASASIVRLGNAADQAASGVAGGGAAGAAGASGTATDSSGEVVVTGRRNPIASALAKVGEKIAGTFTNPESAAKIGQSIGKFAGKGLEGAATGSVVAGVSKALGIKMSGTGAQIGGAIGNFLPIPGGSIIGSIAGGLLGGLFSKTKTGSATISNVGGEAGISGVGGNSGSYKKAASGLAGSVIDSLNSVVDALGGELGDFAVSIGQRKKKYVVDTTGRGKTKGGGTQSYDTAEEAAAAALVNAIADGAVKGISPAMQRALQNSDVEKGVKEALKVKEVEALIGGLGSALKSQFDAFDTVAASRVATARKYGLDILAVEKINGEQRAKLVDDTLKTRIGSLSDFLDNLKFGDLGEGTAADKRNALLDKIKGVQADAEAGKDGAADQLAQLYAQLVQNSRDAFGTAGGEYTGDRANAQSGVERVIAMETDRVNQAAGITAAAQATTTAVQQNNALTGETNDLLAQVATEVRNLSPLLASKIGYGYGYGDLGLDYGITSRFPNLALQ